MVKFQTATQEVLEVGREIVLTDKHLQSQHILVSVLLRILDEVMKHTASLFFIHVQVESLLIKEIKSPCRRDKNHVPNVKNVLSFQFVLIVLICTHLLEVGRGVYFRGFIQRKFI